MTTSAPPRTEVNPGAQARPGADLPGPSRVNDFAFKIGTVNGTGSSSANSMLMKAIYRMGIPISGKNVFPSNIQGLPTWYEIRVSGEGFTARVPRFDMIVAMNLNTYARDVKEVVSGGWILYDDSWPMSKELLRDDVTFLGIPLAKMCAQTFMDPRERILMKNIVYVGALAALLDIEMGVLKDGVQATFAKKKALIQSNFLALDMGFDYAKKHFSCPLPIRLQRLDATSQYVMMDGNTAAALGAVYAGATVGAWYPITPATSVMDNFKVFCERYRKTEDGERKFLILQAEDELAAAGMAVGAAWAGARSFSPTSGPGISLMSEFIGLAYYAEIPTVIFDIQRTGPSTGMPTRTQQGDIMLCAYASHGDTRHICLYPAHPGECFELAVKAFDLAEHFQTPVFMLSDLDIGMNDWMIPRLKWDDSYRPDRGKVLSAETLEKMDAFYRYLDVDGDAIPQRTLPGVHGRGAYFARGSGHDRLGRYTEDPEAYADVMERLARKHRNAAHAVPPAIIERQEGAVAGLVTLGGCDYACREALARLSALGLPVDYMRVRAFPFGDEVEEFLASHDPVFVVEQNRDAQLLGLFLLETKVSRDRLVSVRYYAGMPMSCDHVLAGVLPVLEAAPDTVGSDAASRGINA